MENKIVKIKFNKDQNYRRIHGTGFIGGTTANGELEFDIFEDCHEYPEMLEITFPEGEGGDAVEKKIPENTDITNVNRIQHIGVVLPLSVVPGIIEWLQQKLDDVNKPQNNLK
ncbi:hypothetical protein [Dehalobacterium formicoaceticum]|uniref:hypothetical protein n=1 Tax=Dehalobacterium formicoaceticum TaxID=51515 RepID=UPI0031F6B0BD